MKTLVIFYADENCRYISDNSFDNKNAFDLALNWAKAVCSGDNLGDKENTPSGEGHVSGSCEGGELKAPVVLLPSVVLSGEKTKMSETSASLKAFFEKYAEAGCIRIQYIEDNSVSSLFKGLSEALEEAGAENAVFSYADTPFLNVPLTEKIIGIQTEFKAEYTFADGYPYGFTPEILNAGTVKILLELSKETYKDSGLKKIERTSVFDFLKLDINQYEIETCICDEDLSLLRLSFCTASYLDFKSSLEFHKKVQETCGDSPVEKLSEEQIISTIKNTPEIYKTVPSYYNLQITSKRNFTPVYEPESPAAFSGEKTDMSKAEIESLISKISAFSREAWICPSLLGEPLLHPDFTDFCRAVFSKPALNLLIETDGLLVSEQLCQKLKALQEECSSGAGTSERKFIWIVRLDAVSPEMYASIRGGKPEEAENLFNKAFSAVSILEKYFPDSVYPQFVRMNENEKELENFWRFWSDKNSPSKGKVLIQKYSTFCGLLPERKSAVLSPLERNACYHLRRDMSIFADGTVPLCRECAGNFISAGNCSCAGSSDRTVTNILGNAFKNELEEIFRKSDEEFKNHLKNKYCCECEKCDEFYTFNF